MQGWKGSNNASFPEVRLDSGDLALMPQKQIAAKKKGPRF
jgi:hypothetical protein